MKLLIGVNDIPEWNSRVMLPEVAQHLENKYGLFNQFVENNLPEISDDLLNSINGALTNALVGGPVAEDPTLEGCSKITARFRDFLDKEDMAKLGIAGVPTKAALKGVNRRFKKKKSGRRPSFIETGTLRQNLQTWTEK